MDKIILTDIRNDNYTNCQNAVFEYDSFRRCVQRIKNHEKFDFRDVSGYLTRRSLPSMFLDMRVLVDEYDILFVYEVTLFNGTRLRTYLTKIPEYKQC